MSAFGTSSFDVRTAYLIIALLDFALPTFVWVALSAQRRAAVELWCGGGLVIGMAFMLMGLRGHAPEWVTYACGNLLLLVGVLMHAQSLRVDLGMAWRTRGMVLVTLAYIATYELLRLEVNDGILRLQLVYALYIVLDGLLLHIGLLAWRISRVEASRNARWIARSYWLVVAALVLRQLAMFTGIGGAKALVSGVDMQLLALALVVNAVIGHVGYVGLALDRSTRREVKAAAALARDEVSRRLGTQIATLDRQRSLGTMAASLGHELSQPLNAVLTNAQVAQRGLQRDRFDATQISEFLEKIVRNTQRANQIIDRIRGFIRPADSKSEPVNLDQVAHEVAELVADEAKWRGVTLTFEPVEQAVMVSADPVQLSQVVLNIVRNAMEALSEANHREVYVAIRRQHERAILSIRDTGTGLTPEVLKWVGSPFFTTKAEGLGLGLSISRTLTEQYGGRLSIHNADGGGTLVELDFPVVRAPGEEGKEA